jgi:hypothetical protein
MRCPVARDSREANLGEDLKGPHRQPEPIPKRLERRAEPSSGQDRRVDASTQLSHGAHFGSDSHLPERAEGDDDMDELLLRAIPGERGAGRRPRPR